MNLGPGEIAAIILVIVLLFGAKRIPELARSVGEGIREFKKTARGTKEDDDKTDETKQSS